MLKVGDHISSSNKITAPTNPFGRCKYCNNLSRPTDQQGHVFRGHEIRLKDLCDENRNQNCRWCASLARCIKTVEPDTLKMVETNPEQWMWCSINQHNAICICWDYTRNVRIVERNSFQLFRWPNTEPLHDGLDIPTCPELATEPGQEPMWDYLRQCLMKCLWSHSECRNAQQLDWFPKRLLYIENTARAYSNTRLIHTDEHLPSGPYMALSHCWGDAQHVRSLTTNIAEFEQHIDIERLPAVFQDCVTSAKKFGVNYVWIDALCIIQDDRADWVSHARQMDQIFEHAILVVAAVTSKDGSVPFLGSEAPNKRHLRTSHPVDLGALPGAVAPARVRRFLSADGDLTAVEGPLTRRAWAWQEHVLSTRIIHFTESQTIWECVEARGSEMMGNLEPRSDAMRTKIRGPESTHSVWHHAVNEYGKRSLTYPADRLPALSGVAARFQPLFNTQYHAGLWRSRMVLELAWERSHILSLLTANLPPSLDNSVPSWSWASINSAVSWDLETYFSEVTIKYSVIDIDCEPSTDNALGEVRPGSSILLEGEYVLATLVTDERGFAIIVRDGFEPQLVAPDCQLVQADQTIDQTETGVIRRALPAEDVVSEEQDKKLGEVAQQKMSGPVVCLLLFNGRVRAGDIESAVVLILAPLGPDRHMVQRVALGRGGPDKLDRGGHSIPWQWSSYETWEKWEAWFAGAEKGQFRVF